MLKLSYQCSNEWEDLERVGERRRLCHECEHEVHDLRGMDSDQLRAFREQHRNARVCVLGTTREIQSSRRPSWAGAVALTLPLLLAACDSTPVPTAEPPAMLSQSSPAGPARSMTPPPPPEEQPERCDDDRDITDPTGDTGEDAEVEVADHEPKPLEPAEVVEPVEQAESKVEIVDNLTGEKPKKATVVQPEPEFKPVVREELLLGILMDESW